MAVDVQVDLWLTPQTVELHFVLCIYAKTTWPKPYYFHELTLFIQSSQ